MLRNRVLRTSSFRLALMYAALTGVSFVILLGVIFISTTRFMRHQIDDSVSSEVGRDFGGCARSRRLDAIRPVVHGAVQTSGRDFTTCCRMRTARCWPVTCRPSISRGNSRMATVLPQPEIFAFSAIRGRGTSVAGGYLFVGWSTNQLNEMEEMVVGSFAWGLAASIALALAGGWVMSRRLMRRIETVSNTSRNIIGERLAATRAGDAAPAMSSIIWPAASMPCSTALKH